MRIPTTKLRIVLAAMAFAPHPAKLRKQKKPTLAVRNILFESVAPPGADTIILALATAIFSDGTQMPGLTVIGCPTRLLVDALGRELDPEVEKEVLRQYGKIMEDLYGVAQRQH